MDTIYRIAICDDEAADRAFLSSLVKKWGSAKEAAVREITRAAVSVEKAAKQNPGCIMVVGNAPTALMKIRELSDKGIFTPSLVIGVPVGFVNVVEAKEEIIDSTLPYIVAKGRKGGSNVAAAIVNALFYMAAEDDKEWRRC